MTKLCVIYNMAARYRASIFRLMDRELDIDWYYGYQIGDVKEMDASELKRVTRTGRRQFGPLSWQTCVVPLIWRSDYDTYLMLGEPFTISTWVFCLMKKIFKRRKRVYFWSHGWYGREGFFKKWLKRAFFWLADGTFLYGNYAREKAIEQGNNPDKLWVIHNSLDHERHIELREKMQRSDIYSRHFSNNNPTLIFIGRLTRVKRLDLVIKALRLLKTEGKCYNLILVGDGSESDNLKALAKSEGVENVWFYGSCYDDAETATLIYNADLCISPGNVGLTAIHSMTFGTPVLTHNNFTAQMPEFEAIHDGITGTFFNENDINSMASKIKEWFTERNNGHRQDIRLKCYHEIDSCWTPKYTLNVLFQHLN